MLWNAEKKKRERGEDLAFYSVEIFDDTVPEVYFKGEGNLK